MSEGDEEFGEEPFPVMNRGTGPSEPELADAQEALVGSFPVMTTMLCLFVGGLLFLTAMSVTMQPSSDQGIAAIGFATLWITQSAGTLIALIGGVVLFVRVLARPAPEDAAGGFSLLIGPAAALLGGLALRGDGWAAGGLGAVGPGAAGGGV
ncbi:MAG: hypothetical protein AAF907_07055, partial [Planctomycetota bacterium]